MNHQFVPRGIAEVIAGNPAMSHYLEMLADGRQATPHSWLFEDRSSHDVLAEWMKQLEKLKHMGLNAKRIYQFELPQVEKFGPMGEIAPITALKDKFDEQYTPSRFDAWHPLFSESTLQALAKQTFQRLCSLDPLRPEEAVDDMRERDTLSTNSGYPDFGRRNRPEILQRAIADAHSGAWTDYPAIVLFRNYYSKTRMVWMFPEATNIVENTFVQPIMDAMQLPSSGTVDYVRPWRGFEDVKEQFTISWDKHRFAFGGDTTAMDAHMRAAQLCTVFHFVKWLFKRTHWEALERSLKHVSSIPILDGQRTWWVGPHGVASGSGWTQLSETLFQWILFLNFDRAPKDGMGEGDDLVWFFDTQPKASWFVGYLKHYGLPANEAKQSNDANSCTFLQRLFLKGHMSRENGDVLGGVYPTVRALNSSLNPEKFHDPKAWNSDMFCIRQYMILENTVDHPLFEEFVSFVVRGQKDLIPFAKKADADLQRIQAEARLIPGLAASYNQEKREKPLSSFESIRFVQQNL